MRPSALRRSPTRSNEAGSPVGGCSSSGRVPVSAPRVLAEADLGPIVALDLAFQMLRLAPASLGHRVHGDAAALPIAPASVDVVVLVNALLFPAQVDQVLAADGVVVWVNTMAEQTPIHLSADDVVAALPGDWEGRASRAGTGTWLVARRG